MPDREAAIARLLRITDREQAWMEEIGLPDASSIGPFLRDVAEMLREQEPRELTIDEWREWKANPKRDPICKLWENDTSPMWILSPDDVHEPALLMGKLKLFTGKPTFEQCKAVKWDE